jgi:Toprim domain
VKQLSRAGEAPIIAERLADLIDILARQVLPNGNYGPGRRTWRCGSVAGEPGQSLCIWLDGHRRGRARDYAAGWSGDALDLVAAIICKGDLGQGIRWARDWLGLGHLDPETVIKLKRESQAARDHRRHEAERHAIRFAREAKRQWLAGAALRPDDVGWRYLLGRAVDIGALPSSPLALRVHPALWNPVSGRTWPALMAAISAPDGRHVNTHRIWLEAQPDGSVMKAPLARAKLSMPGGYAGGCVRLWRGSSAQPWAAMPESETLLVGEGIEDVLTIVCARPEWRAAAVLSVSSLAGLVLPPQIKRLIWIAQNDPAGSAAARALSVALRVHRHAGRVVSVIRPPRWAKDVNEVVQEVEA